MPTITLPVDEHSPDSEAIRLAAERLRAGGLVAFPTETVYGLGANALDPAAVHRIFEAKGRPASDPLIVHLYDLAWLPRVAQPGGPLAAILAEAFWPGPLTLVLPRQPDVPLAVTAGRDTVAVRVPSHPVARALLLAAGLPIAAPSANRFARPSPTTARHVLDDLDGRVDVVLDSGPVAIGVESTIVDLTCEPPALLRPGGAPPEALRRLLPDLILRADYLAVERGEAAPAPGMFLKHYSPRARVRLFSGPRAAVLQRMRVIASSESGVGILAVDEDVDALAGLPARFARLGPQSDPQGVARRLFAGLRDLDSAGAGQILARAPERDGLSLAIWDRLFRAAEGRIEEVDET